MLRLVFPTLPRVVSFGLLFLLLASCDLIDRDNLVEPPGRIAFAHFDTTLHKSVLYSVNTDGSNLKLLSFPSDSTTNPNGKPTPRGSAFNPRWSFDGRHIVYEESQGPDESHIVTMLADGTEKRDLTQIGGFAGVPRWSQDGTRVLFDDGSYGAKLGWFLIDADGENRTCLFCVGGNAAPRHDHEGNPLALLESYRWGPTPDLLYVMGYPEASRESVPGFVYALRISTREIVERLSEAPLLESTYNQISPDGRRVLLVYLEDAWNVYLVDLPSGTPQLLLHDLGNPHVRWANDSSHIVYLRQDLGIEGHRSKKIYVMDVDGNREEIRVPTPFRDHNDPDLHVPPK